MNARVSVRTRLDERTQTRFDSRGADELPVATSLHVHILDPGFVIPLVAPDHVIPGGHAAIIHLESSISKPGDKDIARHLVTGESRQTRVGSGRQVLDGNLARGVPNANVLYTAPHEQVTPTLLPFDDQPRVAATGRYSVGESPKGRDEVHVSG